jgi:hypothetical protein
MKFCPNCGAELNPEAKFCTACGTPLPAETSAPVQLAPLSQSTYQQQEQVYEQATEASGAFKEAITGNTNLIQRVLNILLKPKEEWLVIAAEQPNPMKLISGYALILALIPAISTFIAYALIGTSEFKGFSGRSFSQGISGGLTQFISIIVGVYILSYVIDWLAPSFESEKNFGKSMQLAVYSSTAMWVAGILLIIPGVRFVSILVGLYSIYLFAIGLPILKATPKDKIIGYVALSIIAIIVITAVLALILGGLLALLFF